MRLIVQQVCGRSPMQAPTPRPPLAGGRDRRYGSARFRGVGAQPLGAAPLIGRALEDACERRHPRAVRHARRRHGDARRPGAQCAIALGDPGAARVGAVDARLQRRGLAFGPDHRGLGRAGGRRSAGPGARPRRPDDRRPRRQAGSTGVEGRRLGQWGFTSYASGILWRAIRGRWRGCWLWRRPPC